MLIKFFAKTLYIHIVDNNNVQEKLINENAPGMQALSCLALKLIIIYKKYPPITAEQMQKILKNI